MSHSERPASGLAARDSRALQPTIERLSRSFSMGACNFYLYDEAGQELVLAASQGLDRSTLGYRMPISTGLTGRVARTRLPLSVRNPSGHPDYHHIPGSGEEKFNAYLGLPIQRQGKLLAVLVVQRDRAFRVSEISELLGAGLELVEAACEAG